MAVPISQQTSEVPCQVCGTAILLQDNFLYQSSQSVMCPECSFETRIKSPDIDTQLYVRCSCHQLLMCHRYPDVYSCHYCGLKFRIRLKVDHRVYKLYACAFCGMLLEGKPNETYIECDMCNKSSHLGKNPYLLKSLLHIVSGIVILCGLAVFVVLISLKTKTTTAFIIAWAAIGLVGLFLIVTGLYTLRVPVSKTFMNVC